MIILGINGATNFDGNFEGSWMHGSGATLIKDGELIASVSEERFSRIKYDGQWPMNSMRAMLQQHSIFPNDVDIVYYVTTVNTSVKSWYDETMTSNWIRQFFPNAKVTTVDHHLAHAAAAIFSSGFEQGNFLTLDNSGNTLKMRGNTLFGNCGSFGTFSLPERKIQRHRLIYSDPSPDDNEVVNTLGHLYTRTSMVCLAMLKANQGNHDILHRNEMRALSEGAAGKIMGLAAYGKPIELETNVFNIKRITKYDVPDIWSRMDFSSEEWINHVVQFRPQDLAHWVQRVMERTVLEFLAAVPSQFRENNLVYSGGCALNITVNSLILRSGLYKNLFVPTAPNDDGLHQGAAFLAAWENDVKLHLPNNMGCIGLEYQITSQDAQDIVNEILDQMPSDTTKATILPLQPQDITDYAAGCLAKNQLVAWFQGRSEFGPRALGNRSIFAHPGHDNKDLLNSKIKFREPWRPYAAMVMQSHVHDWFDLPVQTSPYMLFNSEVREHRRSTIPSVTHVDNSCRIQTVTPQLNAKAHALLEKFCELTGIPLLLNTSFNTLPGEPIVENPRDAVKSWLYSQIDVLIINDIVMVKQTENSESTTS